MTEREQEARRLRQEIANSRKQLKEVERRNPIEAAITGATNSIHTTGTVLGHSNPLRPVTLISFWAMGIGLFIVIKAILFGLAGVLVGAVDRRALPVNAPESMRFGHAVSTISVPILTGAVNGAGSGTKALMVNYYGGKNEEHFVPTQYAPSPGVMNGTVSTSYYRKP